MKMWLFRSTLRPLESYHSIKDLETFKKECHDFYLLQLIWYLENGYIDEAVVWRLKPRDSIIDNIYFDVNGKPFNQRWVNDFKDCIEPWFPCRLKGADISFFRGGFKEYDELTKHQSANLLGTKLYLGAGQRTYPQYGGHYDKVLLEENVLFGKTAVPFYKTASSNIFYSRESMGTLYDICFPSNFTQVSYKGQERFIKQISKSDYLKSLSIVHLGNKPEIGISLCKKYRVSNIEFKGWVNRHDANKIINQSKFGLVNSNKTDGTPRVITEILSTGTPLFISDQTRVLDYYKCPGVLSFNDVDFERIVKIGIDNYKDIKKQTMNSRRRFTLDMVCKRNWKEWKKRNIL